MGAIRCASCGSSAVDHEGYCWTCEQQNEVAGLPPPGWIAPSEVVFEDLPEIRAKMERKKISLRTILVPPLATFLVISLGMAGYFAFKAADAIMTAPPAGVDLANSGASPAASASVSDTCVVGAWRHSSIDGMIGYNGAQVRVTGNGGTQTFAQDGTGVDDYSGRAVSGLTSGKVVTFTLSGSTRFRYRIFGKKIVFQYSGDKIPMTITMAGVVTSGTYAAVDGEADLSCTPETLQISAGGGNSVTSTRVR